MCRKRVGLTGEQRWRRFILEEGLSFTGKADQSWFDICASGFDCRCGNLFCGIHRYSDKHNCPYDYKAEAAAKIRKENPVVVADKIQRI